MRDESYVLKDMTKYKYCKKNDAFDYLLNMPVRRFSKNKIKEHGCCLQSMYDASPHT